jgi:hypothetical protein
MHWTAGFRVCGIPDAVGPPPVMSTVMRRGKVIFGAVLFVLIAGLAILGILLSGPVLAWKVVSVQPQGPYWVRDGMEAHCWCVKVEVTNLTPSEVIVDWNRDETAFEVAGQWESLGIAALMPHLGPHESRTFPLVIPQRAQACRLRMYYENGPLWSKADRFLRDHGIYVPDKFFIPGMKLNKKLPGHFRCLDIGVKIDGSRFPS